MTDSENIPENKVISENTRLFKYYDIGTVAEEMARLRKDGRVPANTSWLMKKRLESLDSGNEEAIRTMWGNYYYEVGDAITTFRDEIKISLDCVLLRGMNGVEGLDGRVYVIVDVADIPQEMLPHFSVTQNNHVSIRLINGEMSLSVSQYEAMPGLVFKRKDLIINRGRNFNEALRSKDLRYLIDRKSDGVPADEHDSLSYRIITSTFEQEKLRVNSNANMELSLRRKYDLQNIGPNEARLEILCIYKIGTYRSQFNPHGVMDMEASRLVGILEKYAHLENKPA